MIKCKAVKLALFEEMYGAEVSPANRPIFEYVGLARPGEEMPTPVFDMAPAETWAIMLALYHLEGEEVHASSLVSYYEMVPVETGYARDTIFKAIANLKTGIAYWDEAGTWDAGPDGSDRVCAIVHKYLRLVIGYFVYCMGDGSAAVVKIVPDSSAT